MCSSTAACKSSASTIATSGSGLRVVSPAHRGGHRYLSRRRRSHRHLRRRLARHPGRLDLPRRRLSHQGQSSFPATSRAPALPPHPVFLIAEREETNTIPLDAMQLCDEFIWTLEDTANFIGGRVTAAMNRYREHIPGPMASALFKFAGVSEYSWHTPGHSGGTAFVKSPPGRNWPQFRITGCRGGPAPFPELRRAL